jgi:hypothetical protein
VPPALEFGLQPDFQDLPGEPFSGQAAPQDQEIGIIVLTAHPRSVMVVAKGGPHSGKTIGHDGHPDAAAADQDPPVHFSPGDFLGHPRPDVGVIHRIFIVRSQIYHLDLLSPEVDPQIFFELKAGVIAAEADLHVRIRTS